MLVLLAIIHAQLGMSALQQPSKRHALKVIIANLERSPLWIARQDFIAPLRT
jgi:hypothetical protein